jgi:hypothetical protein
MNLVIEDFVIIEFSEAGFVVYTQVTGFDVLNRSLHEILLNVTVS